MNPHEQANHVSVTGIEMGTPQPAEGHMFYQSRFLVTDIVPAGGTIEGAIHTYHCEVKAEQLVGTLTYTVNTAKGTVTHDISKLEIIGKWAEEGYVIVSLDLHAKSAPGPAKKAKASKKVKHKRMAASTASLMGRLNLPKETV